MHTTNRLVLWAAAGLAAAASTARSQVRLAPMRVGGDFGALTNVGQPPGETRRMFVVEQGGVIWIVRDGATVPAPFLDVSAQIFSGGESGLLGLAFHPGFQTNGFVYVYYTAGSGATAGGHLVRYHTDPASPELAELGTATEIMFIARSPTINHQGGWIGFGPDGYLYHSNGEAGIASNAPDITVLLGKILRIDVDHDDFPADPVQNYAIPPTNPFAGATPGRDEIWAVGLRNPWRCSFDRATGDFWIGDVGEGTREEINFQPAIGAPPYAARNYGWPCREGTACHIASCCNDPSLIPPIYDYGDPAAAVIAGYVYRGQAIPELAGTFFFGDLGGLMWSFRYNGSAITEFTDRTAELPPGSLRSFGEDSRGELYYCAGDRVFKIVRACAADCDNSTQPPILNANDFVCFQSRFAAQDPYANCDQNTSPPLFTVNDFVCFTQVFAAGCP